ncbi:hypothetical protein [Aliarcobacter vitoriensis]|nr:hypothetical protein [Aliarcobacter vitoriensis]
MKKKKNSFLKRLSKIKKKQKKGFASFEGGYLGIKVRARESL